MVHKQYSLELAIKVHRNVETMQHMEPDSNFSHNTARFWQVPMLELYNTVQYSQWCGTSLIRFAFLFSSRPCRPLLLLSLGKRLSRDSAGGGEVAGWVGGCGEAGRQVIGREQHENQYEREQVALQVGWCLVVCWAWQYILVSVWKSQY